MGAVVIDLMIAAGRVPRDSAAPASAT